VPDSGLFGPQAGRVIARSAQGAHYEHEGRDVDWTKVRDPIVLEGPAVLVGQRHPEAHHRGDHGSDPRPPFPAAHAPPGQGSHGDAGGGDEPCRGHVQVPDVVHDRRIQRVQIVPGDAVGCLHSQFKVVTREVAEQEHDRVADERHAPDQHQSRALLQAGPLP
jgi:hypothetical protein